LSFKDFWSRWHISLSTWFRDYVYIPLGGSRKGKVKTNVNLLITFIVSGFFFFSNWTFIVWGALHGIYQIIEKSIGKIRFPKILKLLFVFILTNLAWIFFRAQSIDEAFLIIEKILSMQSLNFYIGDKGIFAFSILSIVILLSNDIATEYFPKIKLFNHKSQIIRYTSIVFIVVYIISLGVFDGSQFIYFQF
ncbi:MAG: MBOAT family protein, partial [Ignavibacteriae bacterium]|nr:MBOAT family protein [Ignavibacteriota bacterium]